MLYYLYLHLFTVFFPLVLSFDWNVKFYKNWRFFFPAMAIVASFFLAWDVLFTKWNVWGFDQNYLVGVDILNLPVEEVLFFVTIPFACVFIYEVLNFYIKKDYIGRAAPAISVVIASLLLVVGIMNLGKIYTSVTFILTACFLLLLQFVFKARYLGRFYVAYLISLIPFFIVNGILTGVPVVIYNDAENLGIRLGSIPVEDTVYSLLLLSMNVALYEFFKQRSGSSFSYKPT